MSLSAFRNVGDGSSGRSPRAMESAAEGFTAVFVTRPQTLLTWLRNAVQVELPLSLFRGTVLI